MLLISQQQNMDQIYALNGSVPSDRHPIPLQRTTTDDTARLKREIESSIESQERLSKYLPDTLMSQRELYNQITNEMQAERNKEIK